MGKKIDEEEEEDKEEHRRQVRERYEKEQIERQQKWVEEQRIKGKSEKEIEEMKQSMINSGCGHNHMPSFDNNKAIDPNHNHNHNHNHDHNQEHDHNKCNHNHNQPQKQSYKPSCGFMPIEEIERLEEEKKKNPQLTNQEKNVKKIQAVKATREDGNNCYKKGDYETAFKIYERGVLIINGMYGLNEEEENEMEHFEYLLDLNMAAAKLQMKEWTDTIENARMALQLNNSSAKAYYRWSQALIGMGEYEEAKVKCLQALELCKNDANEKKKLRYFIRKY